MLQLLANADVGPFWGMGFIDIVIRVIVITAIVAIAYIVMVKVFKIAPPDWLLQILWIVLGVVVAVVAIKYIASIW